MAKNLSQEQLAAAIYQILTADSDPVVDRIKKMRALFEKNCELRRQETSLVASEKTVDVQGKEVEIKKLKKTSSIETIAKTQFAAKKKRGKNWGKDNK